MLHGVDPKLPPTDITHKQAQRIKGQAEAQQGKLEL
jgi:hypothetical protein